jgi:hypothetical protein
VSVSDVGAGTIIKDEVSVKDNVSVNPLVVVIASVITTVMIAG